MTLINWKSKQFLTGIEKMDFEHQKLSFIINEIYKNIKEKNIKNNTFMFNEFYESLNLHFASEEAFLNQIKYPNISQHKNEHFKIIKKIKEFNEIMKNNNKINLCDILNNIKLIISIHIQKSDIDYSNFFYSSFSIDEITNFYTEQNKHSCNNYL